MKLPCLKCGRVEPKSCSNTGCPYFVGRPRTMKKEYSGEAPNIFVGTYGYPDIRVGILSTEDYKGNDEPVGWSQYNVPISKIIDLRGSLINSNFVANVRSGSNTFLEEAQLVAQAKNPADMEISLDRAPSFKIAYPTGTSPHGASVRLKQAKLTENVKIPKKVDKAVSDIDLKAASAIGNLYGNVDEYAIQKLLTGGLLGTKPARKLVPTKWSITAVDDTVGKQFLEKLRELQVIGEPIAFFGGHYGNHYLVMVFPRLWQYELFEMYVGKADMKVKMWTDHERFEGRKNYASDTVGGYYAARLPLTEKLIGMKRQGAVLVLRFVTDEYTNPLGVWVVREAVKKTMDTKPLTFASEELLLKYAEARCKQFGINYEEEVKKKSLLLSSFKQRTLEDF